MENSKMNFMEKSNLLVNTKSKSILPLLNGMTLTQIKEVLNKCLNLYENVAISDSEIPKL